MSRMLLTGSSARAIPSTRDRGPGSVALQAVALLVAALCGCGDEAPDEAPQAPPVIEEAAPPPIQRVEEPAPPPVHVHKVKLGETLWDIARAYGTTIAAIREENGLSPADAARIRDGIELRIPGATGEVEVETAADRRAKREARPELDDGVYHDVEPGETLWTLSSRYDVAVDAIMERNALDDESATRLHVGQTLVIPGVTAETVAKAAASRKLDPGTSKPERRGITHAMATGETIWDLARAFQVGAGEIMAANALTEEQVTRLREGQKVFIPGVERDIRGAITRGESARDKRAEVVAKKLGLGTRQVGLQLLRGRVQRRWVVAAGGTADLPGYLRWPVAKGWYVRGYGSGEGGYHLATDIAGNIGWNVRAAAPGIVAYADNTLRGYGNTVIVVHPGGWITMYAHNSVSFVKAGEKVKRGSILAEVGSTGISRGPHVHFEFIYDGRNCDPSALFRPGIQHRSGRRSDVKTVMWRNPKDRPKAVRCDRRRRHPKSRYVVDESPEEDK